MTIMPLMGLLLSAMLISSCGKEAASGKSTDSSPKNEESSPQRLFHAEAEIRRAVKGNDTVSLRQVIFDNPDLSLNTYFDDGDTLLAYAIKKKFHLIRNILLDKGALADQVSLHVDFPGQSPLMIAAHLGDTGAINALLKFNASINLQDQNGDTALHKAIKNGYTEAARVLMLAGADLKIENDQSESPFETAVALGRKEIILEFEAQVNLERGRPSVARLRQVLNDGDIVNYRKIVDLYPEIILEYASINPLVLAIDSKNDVNSFEMAQSLLWLKISPDGPRDSETTPLIRAVTLRKKNIVELLLSAKPNLLKVDSNDRPALAYAILNNDEAMVDLLFSMGAPESFNEVINGRRVIFRGCRLARSTLRKQVSPEEIEISKNILLRLGCGRSR